MTTINRNTVMSISPLTIKVMTPLNLKIVVPYACAIYSLAVDRGNLYQITKDFRDIKFFWKKLLNWTSLYKILQFL